MAAQDMKETLKKLEKERKEIDERRKQGGQTFLKEQDLEKLKGDFIPGELPLNDLMEDHFLSLNLDVPRIVNRLPID